ncbi:HAMP domain-containing sensor histidine kinase [Sedimentibacter saalensis]|uniref:histidine kinase n=1 Tax=Sedimentibacter saalensis TaxID=130788 RepID=A0A562J839_9FIRM|nr:HAMP domain-containing sensor histidine kinase [Sedimentibacter saalensis]TWH79336.1 signal transduction histidine kinase [Sedimentibacter saalensis]
MLVTKWKTYKRKKITKIAAFILLIICLLIGVSSALDITLNVQDYESITVKSYMKSNTLSNELRYAANRLEHLIRVYKSEKYIRDGKTVKYIDIDDSWQLTNLYNNYLAEKGYEDNADSEELFWIEKDKEIQDIKESIKKSDLVNYQNIIEDLNNPEGLIYYATDGYYECTNTGNDSRNHYSLQNAYVLIDGRGMKVEPNNGYSSYSSSLVDTYESIEDGTNRMVIYAAITDEGLSLRVDKWLKDRHTLIVNIFIITMCLIVLITCLAYLLAETGKVAEDEAIHMAKFDRLFPDLSLLVIAGIIAIINLGFYNVFNIRYTSEKLMKLAMLSSAAALFSLFLIFFLSIARHYKNRTLVKKSLAYMIITRLSAAAVKIAAGGPLMFKSIAALISLMAVSAYFSDNLVLLIVVGFAAVYYVSRKVRTFEAILKGLRTAKQGDYEFKIQVDGSGEFKQLSEDINTITSGFNIAVQNEVKSERLKSELITNVSHDIKTPLTSIISYVDLLKREGLQSPNAPKYLDVLDRKSSRLKTLTEDLFEAAKATSGSIEAHFERVNVNALVSQILGELDEKIMDSKLTFKVTSTDERLFAKADGRLLSRVMENLLSNIFKYALKESRVYIDLSQTEKEVFICFKNVSAFELNIPADELMLRFKRGDESRSSEGSGLGLAIAKSLMEIQNGILDISIDGDLFKAEIRLEKFH